MAGIKPKVKTPAQMRMEMAVDRARVVLPKAERDENLVKFLEGSKISDRLYHGTGADITNLNPSRQGAMGPGVYLTSVPKEASSYAEVRKNINPNENPNVMPLYAQVENPFYISSVNNSSTEFFKHFDPEGKLSDNEVIELAKKLGYDAIHAKLEGVTNVLEPNKIKSAIGNQGTYDINEPDITKAHGGAVHMAGGGKLPKVSAPSVMKRSGISELAEYIKNREGEYGLRRVERAADEIPRLGELYSQDALRSAFSGDNARALMTLKPSEFENYATPLLTDLSKESKDNIANLQAIQSVGGFSDVPFFLVNKELAGSTGLPWVTGHEGRHRNRAMDAAGVQSGLVQFLPRAELREPFPRRSQEQYIEAIKKEMELSGNKIKPEKYYLQDTDENIFQRPAIDLPDLYAQGGAVNMRDGGDPEREFIDQMREGFSVYNKPTYGSEIPGTPTIDQQRYALTMKGQQDAENRARVQKDSLTAIDPSGTLGVTDVLSTIGKGIVAIPVHAARQAMHWLQGGKQKDAPTGKDYEAWMQPKTQEGAEFLETLGEIPEKITGSTMGFGMHPNLWVSGLGTPSVSQMRAGLKLGAERAAPVIGKIDDMVRTGYESGAIPQPGMSIKDVTPRVLAPANEQGFYSPTEAAALNLQRKSGSGQAFLNDLLKQENVRPDEINAMGLDEWLKGKKDVTAAEVQDYIANNKIQLGESTYKDQPKITPEQKTRLSELQRTNYNRMYPEEFDAINGAGSYEELMRLQNARDGFNAERLEYEASRMAREARKYQTLGTVNGDTLASQYRYKADHLLRRAELASNESRQPKFRGYQLPGGENYREVVITMPPKELRSPEQLEYAQLQKKMRSGNFSPEDSARFWELDKGLGTEKATEAVFGKRGETYRSSHWDDPNPLAHLRMSDRVTDGKKTLLVDEVQSDWHQAGREKGYKSDFSNQEAERFQSLYDRHMNSGDLSPQEIQEMQFLNEKRDQSIYGVPDAPFKDDWYQLALKRAIKEAIDGGYDRVALPTGARVSERFDLSKQIDRIDYNKNDDGTYSMSAIKGGKEVFSKEGLDENELSGLVGKDVAKKIVGDEGKAQYDADIADELGVGVVKSLTGLDLSVGGKGMKKYYDDIYPGYLKKFGKRYGSTVGKTTVDVDGVAEPLHYMEITPAMREAFKTGIHMKRGGKVSFANDIDAMRLELSKG